MSEPILSKLDELIAVTRASSPGDLYLDAAGVAALLNLSPTYVRDSVVKEPEFPAPLRLTDRAHPRWLRSEVLRWAKTHHRR